jgi:AcrR family transcriptional regulator
MSSPQADREKADSRQRILEAGARLFARKGFAATGVRELATEAGVNLAMVNYFFGSKLGLLEEILKNFFEPWITLSQEAFKLSDDPEERLRIYIRRIVHYCVEHHNSFMVYLLEVSRDEPEILDLKASYMEQLVKLYVAQIFEPLFEKTGRRLPVGILGPALAGLISSHFQLRPMALKLRPQEVENLNWDEYADIIAGLYLNGINGLLTSTQDSKDQGE